MPKVTITMEIDDIVVETEDHGGFVDGECRACHKTGWLVSSLYGFPPESPQARKHRNALIHTPDCPVLPFITKNGAFKKS
jgi:hypothetical protein